MHIHHPASASEDASETRARSETPQVDEEATNEESAHPATEGDFSAHAGDFTPLASNLVPVAALEIAITPRSAGYSRRLEPSRLIVPLP